MDHSIIEDWAGQGKLKPPEDGMAHNLHLPVAIIALTGPYPANNGYFRQEKACAALKADSTLGAWELRSEGRRAGRQRAGRDRHRLRNLLRGRDFG